MLGYSMSVPTIGFGNDFPQPAVMERQIMTNSTSDTLTAAETARRLNKLGFNWLDVEFVLEFAPHQKDAGHMRYPMDTLQQFVNRAFWLNETPIDFSPAPTAA